MATPSRPAGEGAAATPPAGRLVRRRPAEDPLSPSGGGLLGPGGPKRTHEHLGAPSEDVDSTTEPGGRPSRPSCAEEPAATVSAPRPRSPVVEVVPAEGRSGGRANASCASPLPHPGPGTPTARPPWGRAAVGSDAGMGGVTTGPGSSAPELAILAGPPSGAGTPGLSEPAMLACSSFEWYTTHPRSLLHSRVLQGGPSHQSGKGIPSWLQFQAFSASKKERVHAGPASPSDPCLGGAASNRQGRPRKGTRRPGRFRGGRPPGLP